jgi:hypothetical protein
MEETPNIKETDYEAIGGLTSQEVSELISKAVKEKTLAKNSAEQKKQRFRDRQILYNNPNNTDEKIRVNLVR